MTEPTLTMLPTFITFTGLDEWTDPAAFGELTRWWPIEAAFLFSPTRQGNDNRYPSGVWIERCIKELREQCGDRIRFAAHLCGEYSRLLVDRKPLPTVLDRMLANHFQRVQVNGAPAHTADHLANWGRDREVSIVLQAPKQFPEDQRVSFLLDGSAGRGITPQEWPAPPKPTSWVGYAGGLSPDNVSAAVAAIGAVASYYWLDMETGVRSNNWFCVSKCRAVCRAVYGGGE